MSDEENKKSKSSWLPQAAFAILILGASVGTTWYMNKGNQAAASVPTVEAIVPETPVYVRVEPFTVNVRNENGRSQYLHAGFNIRAGNEETAELLRVHMPQLRSRIMVLLSAQPVEKLSSPEGKSEISELMMNLFKMPLTTPQPALVISEVLFSEFVIR